MSVSSFCMGSESFFRISLTCFCHIYFPAKPYLVTWLALPNEINNINPKAVQSHKYFSSIAKHHHCMFQWILYQVIYFHWWMVCVTRNLWSQLLLRLKLLHRIMLFKASYLTLLQASTSKGLASKIFCLSFCLQGKKLEVNNDEIVYFCYINFYNVHVSEGYMDFSEYPPQIYLLRLYISLSLCGIWSWGKVLAHQKKQVEKFGYYWWTDSKFCR